MSVAEQMTEAPVLDQSEGYVTEDGRKIGAVVMEMKNITLRFGGVVAIKDISFDIREGEIRAIIGPNGAGKSSMLNVISGFYIPQEGEVLYKGSKRPQMKPYEVARQGIARTFQNIALFEGMTVLDNVMLQRRLLREELGVERLALILGRSMGAQIAYQWASYFADEVDRFIPLCGSAKTAAHNYAFLSTVKACITADPAWQGGEYGIQPMSGIRMMRTVFDTWGVGQGFFRAGLHLGDRFATTQQFLDRSDDRAIGDANDLLAQVWTWENADLSANDKFEGDVAQALSAITAKAIVMPGRHDLYFPPEDSEIEVAGMRNAELRVIDSLWGHRSAAPGSDPRDIAVLEQALTDILAR